MAGVGEVAFVGQRRRLGGLTSGGPTRRSTGMWRAARKGEAPRSVGFAYCRTLFGFPCAEFPALGRGQSSYVSGRHTSAVLPDSGLAGRELAGEHPAPR